MKGQSQTPQEEKIKILQSLLPEVFDESKIDWEKLKATLGENVNFSNERYVLNWAGKSEAFRIMQQPSSATLVPCRDDSEEFDDTQNIFIEGENLEVLKVLQKSYFGKVKMIYIDPPYNTGNDSFIYPDKFSESKEEYLRRVGDKDAEGYMMRDGMFHKNNKENGQYHSNWLNMMMPRLYLAKSLLREDGVIFVSIDDNEVHNLRLLMNEVFGEENFEGQLVVNSTPNARDYGHIGKMHEYLLFYSKSLDETKTNMLKDSSKTFKYFDDKGRFNVHPLYNSNEAFNNENRPNLYYPFYLYPNKLLEKYFYEIGLEKTDNSIEIYPPKSQKNNVQFVWRWGKEKAKKYLNEEIIGYRNENGEYRIVQKMRHNEKIIRSLLLDKKYSSRRGTSELETLLEGKFFSFPKPISLLKDILFVGTEKDSIVLDFFAGSGTTAHAVMELNEDGGNRKYICVQLPELCDEKSETYKAGYATIADICKERIRQAGKKIREDVEAEQAKQNEELPLEDKKEIKMPDLGFKVFKLQDSNFKQWREIEGSNTEKWKQQIIDFQNPVTENATIDNMAYELMLKSGKDLNSHIEHKNGYYAVNGPELVLMLESANQEIIDAVIAAKPQKVIALDNLFEGNDQLKTNTVLQMRDAGIEFKTI